MRALFWESYPTIRAFDFEATNPSNIALIKYWGKKNNQQPVNASLSFTLSKCVTHTAAKIIPGPFDVVVKFESQVHEKFSLKYRTYLEKLLPFIPYLNQFRFEINTTNSFPHSSGIASSASSFASFANILEQWISGNRGESFNPMRASFLARIGSGSACRSIFHGYQVWGHHTDVLESSDDYAVNIDHLIHPSFKKIRDAICLVSSQEKEVSSSKGHEMMNQHPFFDGRIKQAQQNLHELLGALKVGDWDWFGKIIENEALTLHALMMSSNPSFILLKPQSLMILEKVKNWRKSTEIPIYFTIDAGPNIHLIYPEEHQKNVADFISEEIQPEFKTPNLTIWDGLE